MRVGGNHLFPEAKASGERLQNVVGASLRGLKPTANVYLKMEMNE